ncbi:MAG: hypothetical protein ACYDH6_16155 [Acidimicrobiales bacterium]
MTDGGDTTEDTPAAGPWSAPTQAVWSGVPPVGDGGRRRTTPWFVIAGCVVVAVLVVAGILGATGAISGSSGSKHAAATLPPGELPPITLPGNGSGALSPDQAVLRQLGVRQVDVSAGTVVQLQPNGDQVLGETTLDLCNGTFPSESRRVARRQVLVGTLGSLPVFSTEAVFYDDTAGTAQAFAEIGSVAAKCPSTAVPSPAGGDALSTKFNAAPDRSWAQTPTVERLAYDFMATGPSGTERDVVVYLRRGRVLMGVYFRQPDHPPTIDGKTSIADIASTFASRLAKLPASIVSGHEAPAAVPGAV